MKFISSANNPLIKKILAVKVGKTGRTPDLLLVEGLKLIDEALRSGAILQTCLTEDPNNLSSRPELSAKAMQVSRAIMRQLSSLTTPAGIIACFEQLPPIDSQKILSNAQLVVVLDRVQDPGNLGTIIRSSEALAADALILLKGTCSPTNPKVIRAAMGSSFRLPIIEQIEQADQAINLLRQHGFACLAVDMQGTPLPSFTFPQKVALFFGQEGQGLQPKISAECNQILAIPMQGQVESLNVATSVALCLYERLKKSSTEQPVVDAKD